MLFLVIQGHPEPGHMGGKASRGLGWLLTLLLLVLHSPLSTAFADGGTAAIVPLLQTTLTNSTPTAGAAFAGAMAALGSDRVIIGAPQGGAGETNAGVAYLFSVHGTLLTVFTNPSPATDDRFGFSVAAVGREDVLVGAYQDDKDAPGAGIAYRFGTDGALQTTFHHPAPAAHDGFGYAVTAAGNDCVLIGAPGDDAGATNAGAAYLFGVNGAWLATFTNPVPVIGAGFGSSVLAVGSAYVLIGAPFADALGTPSAGAAYLFNTNGSLLSTFYPPRSGDFPGSVQRFGAALAAVGSDRVFIGAPQADTDPTSFIYKFGAAYLFRTNGELLTSINNPLRHEGGFGQAVAAVGSNLVLVGAPNNRLGAGSAHLFTTNGTLLSTFTTLKPAFSQDHFGNAVLALGEDRVLVAASADDTGATNAGAAYFFDLVPSLSIRSTLTNTLALSWPVFTPGFAIQQHTNGIATGNWSNVTETIEHDDTNNYLIVHPASGNRFYRLVKP